MNELTDKIFERLSLDISDRRGLKQEWERIDDDIMEEDVKPAWKRIIEDEVLKFNKIKWEEFKKELQIELHGTE